MKSPSKIESAETPLFLDTSVVINLIASRRMEDVRKALNRPFIVEEAVVLEMTRDPRDGGDGAALMRKLADGCVLKFARLNDAQAEQFIQLVGASVPDDLGDGEAATIACAIGNGPVVIDERKARRIIARDFVSLKTYCTLDLLCCKEVCDLIGSDAMFEAIGYALQDGRMRVPPEWKSFVSKFVKLPALVAGNPKSTLGGTS
jgi:predicted nucleic acid-binding protein